MQKGFKGDFMKKKKQYGWRCVFTIPYWERRRFKSSPENRSLEESKSGGAKSWKKFVQKLGEERAAAGARLKCK